MFYPVDSLKRGGRFYLCWVADSWPLRFATITHRQLWSQDIRNICADLLEVMTTESGRPARRFSLRLSSQLLRGLIRLYHRKVTIFLSDLCMMNANVTKHVNQKLVFHEAAPTTPRARPAPARLQQEAPENEDRLEEMIQRSGNVVANIQDITLKESALPEYQPLINDNFGEVHPEQALQLLADKTLEVMMGADASGAQHSGELPALDFSADRSHDRSRLAPHHSALMERISEHDVTLFKKSIGDDLLPIDDVVKEIPGVPEISETLLPELLVPPAEIQSPGKLREIEQGEPKDVPAKESAAKETEVFVLEDLEATEPPAKRRRVRGLIIDRSTQLSSNYLRARIDNIAVELRCEDSSDDVIEVRVPAATLLSRAAAAGWRERPALGRALAALFTRNLGPVCRTPRADREMEVAVAARGRSLARSVLERIDEEVEPAAEPGAGLSRLSQSQLPEHEDVTAPRVSVHDISDLPTQVIPTLTQQSRKRTAELHVSTSPKTPRHSGYVSFRQSQQAQLPPLDILQTHEADKENISDNIPQELRQLSPVDKEPALTSLLRAAGLADLPPAPAPAPDAERALSNIGRSPLEVSQKTRRNGSESSETPLGSLDRTKVSLGDSDRTTDSKRFIRDQWGTEGTMIKIIQCIKAGARPVDVRALLATGPVVAGYTAIIAARCFTSILKLKQHGFVNVVKDPVTQEIRDIALGAKFDQVE